MAESVADLLGRLRFVSAPVETIYLNRDRTHDDFVGQLGAIDSFTRGATREGKLEVPLLKAGAGIGAEAGVTWTMADPTAQALVLRAALESQGLLYPLQSNVFETEIKTAVRVAKLVFRQQARACRPPGRHGGVHSQPCLQAGVP